MEQEIEVKTQAELEKVCGAGDIAIVRSGYFRAYDSSQVTAYGSSQVTAYGSSQVTAYDSSQVTAYGSSQVTAYDSSQVRACGSSRVTACGSSRVTAYGSSQVTACGSSRVTAYGSSQVRACDSSQVTATKQVAITRHNKQSKVKGGRCADYIAPSDVKEWLAEYGLKPVRGVVILYKVVRDDYKSQQGFLYQPGTSNVAAPDWDGGKEECGGGLHFCPFPFMCLQFDNEGKKFVACPVKVSEIVIHKNPQYPNKIKAPRVFGKIYECNIEGDAV